jgi:nicotinamide-nucleotide amidase
MSPPRPDPAAAIVAAYGRLGWRVATAESCTGGLVAAALTGIAGSSVMFERGFVTYSNEAKAEMLGVDPALIASRGAVSEEVARAMAEGALGRSRADVAVSITGVAGPGGGSDAKPVGLVHFGLARRGSPTRHLERRYGDLGRAVVRERAVADALELLATASRDA